jgi:hypothetical protein
MRADYHRLSSIKKVKLSLHVERALPQKQIDSPDTMALNKSNIVSSLTTVFDSWLRCTILAIHYETADSIISREQLVFFLSHNISSHAFSVTGDLQP